MSPHAGKRTCQFLFLLLAGSHVTKSATTTSKSPNSAGKRVTCTPTSATSASVDDVPSIEAAIAECEEGGIIVLPADTTYMLRSPLEFTGCAGCDFQIEGRLKASDDLAY
jgi:galacturan 1,4-alpha-galacturonidase